jgi:predicted metallopeptidase
MSTPSYLIDTNIIIGLEDNHTVKLAYAKFSQLAAKHKVNVFVHEAARDDYGQDKDLKRRQISLSKLAKYQLLEKVKGSRRPTWKLHLVESASTTTKLMPRFCMP